MRKFVFLVAIFLSLMFVLVVNVSAAVDSDDGYTFTFQSEITQDMLKEMISNNDLKVVQEIDQTKYYLFHDAINISGLYDNELYIYTSDSENYGLFYRNTNVEGVVQTYTYANGSWDSSPGTQTLYYDMAFYVDFFELTDLLAVSRGDSVLIDHSYYLDPNRFLSAYWTYDGLDLLYNSFNNSAPDSVGIRIFNSYGTLEYYASLGEEYVLHNLILKKGTDYYELALNCYVASSDSIESRTCKISSSTGMSWATSSDFDVSNFGKNLCYIDKTKTYVYGDYYTDSMINALKYITLEVAPESEPKSFIDHVSDGLGAVLNMSGEVVDSLYIGEGVLYVLGQVSIIVIAVTAVFWVYILIKKVSNGI